MKNSHLLAGCTALAALFAAGCGHLDLAAPGNPSRVVVGTVVISTTLPDDAEIIVRIMDPSSPDPDRRRQHEPHAAGADAAPQPAGGLLNATVTTSAPPEQLGEQTIKHPVVQVDPVSQLHVVPYRVEYQADDDTLRRGVSIEVRISYGGRMQLINTNQYSITLADEKDPHPIEADSMR